MNDLGTSIRKIAFLGDYLPRKCGIATFTSDLLAAVAMNDIRAGYDYPGLVRFEIEEQDLSLYLRAADFLNISNVDVVCLQHEFGIFGGPAGSHILALLRELRMPIVVAQARTDSTLGGSDVTTPMAVNTMRAPATSGYIRSNQS